MKILRFILWIAVCAVFLFGLLYFFSGSLEMFPTPEQQEKARVVAVVMMAIPVIFGFVLFTTRKN